MTEPCRYCGETHGPRCPEVRAIEYHPDGTVKRVEFLTPADRGPMFSVMPQTVGTPTTPPYPQWPFHPHTWSAQASQAGVLVGDLMNGVTRNN